MILPGVTTNSIFLYSLLSSKQARFFAFHPRPILPLPGFVLAGRFKHIFHGLQRCTDLVENFNFNRQ